MFTETDHSKRILALPFPRRGTSKTCDRIRRIGSHINFNCFIGEDTKVLIPNSTLITSHYACTKNDPPVNMEGNSEEKTERPDGDKNKFVHPDGGYGWVVVFSIVLINSAVLTLIQCFGLIFKDVFDSMENKTLKVSTLLHLQSSLYCIVGFFGSPLLKRYGFRSTGLVGAVLMCLGIFLTSFVESYELLICTVSILMGIGQGILMPATYLATYTYFKKRLTIAVSISTTGASILSIFMPKICDILLSKVGRKTTILILSANSLLSLVGCVLMRPLKQEEKETVKPDDDKDEPHSQLLHATKVYNSTTIETEPPRRSVVERLSRLFDLKLLRRPSFVIAFVGLGLSFAAELNTVFLIQFVLPSLNGEFRRADVAYVTSVQFALDLVGRLAVPMSAHALGADPKAMYGGALVLATVARTALAVWSGTYWAVFLCCALIGLSKGTRAVFQSVIIPGLVPLESIPAANGINMLFNGIASMVVGSAIGLVRDVSGSDIPALHMASVISMACVCLWLTEWSCGRRKARDESPQ